MLFVQTLNGLLITLSMTAASDSYIKCNGMLLPLTLLFLQHLSRSYGFWLPDHCIDSTHTDGTADEHILFFEALCVLSAIHHITDVLHVPPITKILMYTDNDNTVASSVLKSS